MAWPRPDVGEEAIDKKPRDTTEALAITAEVTPS